MNGRWTWVAKVLTAFLISQFSFLDCNAQDDPEYRMEIGGGLGLMAYEGDFNGNLMKGMQPLAAVVAKYKSNPRMAWTAQLSVGKVKGSSKDVKTWYPYLHDHPVEFSTGLTDLSLRYEYNFWPFGTGKEYLGAKHLTPFFTFGAGLVFSGKPDTKGWMVETDENGENATLSPSDSYPVDGAQWADGGVVALQVPVGLGVKCKLKDRLNLTAEWVMHFTGSDKLDGVKDPYGIKSSGLFKNTDCYSTLQVSLTYDIWAKCKTCNNDR